MKRFKLLSAVLLFAFTATIQAEVPKLINFQGILRNGLGNPVTDSTYSVSFRIYDAPAGGTLLWQETRPITTSSGLFVVLLGAVAPVPDSVFNDTVRYLGIQIAPDPEMTPREELVSVAYAFRVSAVDGALGGNIRTKVSIGPNHSITGTQAFAAGESDTASGSHSTVSGGFGNVASGDSSAVGGGSGNRAMGIISTVSGGTLNVATADQATVGGGIANEASGVAATVGGGSSNHATGIAATVSGGYASTAGADRSTVSGGEFNLAASAFATVGGGRSNTAAGLSSTVAGGAENHANFTYGTVSGGSFNRADSPSTVIAGGYGNYAGGNAASVGGGAYDTSIGFGSTVPGGFLNRASGSYSMAAGCRARALHRGSFVWADSSADADFPSTANGQFLIRASGGVGVGTNSPTSATGGQVLHINNAGGASAMRLGDDAASGIQWELQSTVIGAAGALNVSNIDSFTNPLTILANGRVGIGVVSPSALLHVNGSAGNNTGVWSTLSDRRLKRDIRPLKHALETVNRLQPVSFRWKDSSKDAELGRVRGLIAQDVEIVIPEWIKTDPDGRKRLEPIGVDALLIAAIQELDRKCAEVTALTARIERLEEAVEQFSAANGTAPADVAINAAGR